MLSFPMTKSSKSFNEYMITEYEKIAEESYIQMSDGSEVKILQTKAEKDKFNGCTFLLIPGWGTVVPGWDELLMEASKDFNVLYIESREKGSFKPAKGKIRNDLDRMGSDIKEVVEYLKIPQEKLAVITSSYSTLIIADVLANKKLNPLITFLIGPVHQFNMPPTTRYIMHILPTFLFYFTKPIWRWWVRKFKSEDPVQAAKYIRVLEEADPKKWRAVAKRTCFIKIWDLYEKMGNRVVVLGMKTDKMHTTMLSKQIHNKIKNSEYFEMETNRSTHSAEMTIFVRNYLEKMDE